MTDRPTPHEYEARIEVKPKQTPPEEHPLMPQDFWGWCLAILIVALFTVALSNAMGSGYD
jgi:hypothetical protein